MVDNGIIQKISTTQSQDGLLKGRYKTAYYYLDENQPDYLPIYLKTLNTPVDVCRRLFNEGKNLIEISEITNLFNRDLHIVLKKEILAKVKKYLSKGYTLTKIAEEIGTTYRTIRFNYIEKYNLQLKDRSNLSIDVNHFTTLLEAGKDFDEISKKLHVNKKDLFENFKPEITLYIRNLISNGYKLHELPKMIKITRLTVRQFMDDYISENNMVDKIRTQLYENKNIDQIVRITGIPKFRILKYLKSDIVEITRIYIKNGKDYKYIENKLKITKRALEHYLRKFVKQSNIKDDIIKLAFEGKNKVQISRETGIPQGMISN